MQHGIVTGCYELMTWTKVYLESMNILQLRELKQHVDQVLEKKIAQSQRHEDYWDNKEKEENDRNYIR